MRSKRYVFVNRYYQPDESATSQMLTDLATGLAARNFTVHVVCSRQLYTDAGAKLPPTEKLSGVTIHRVTTTRFGRAGLIGRMIDYASFYILAALAMLRVVGRGDVLIAKTDPPLISIPAAMVAQLKGAQLVNWQQDVFPEVASLLGANPLPAWLDRRLRRLRDASLRSAVMNVVIGAGMLDYFKSRGIPEAQLCAIENWADADSIRPKPTTQSALRASLGLADRFVVCYSGNLGRAHEFATLLGAADAARADPSILFLIIGGGAKFEPLQRAVAQRELDNFVFLPYQARDALADSLAAADLHVVSLLSSLEGLIVPSKLYGILAAGRPVVYIGNCDGEIARNLRADRCGVAVAVNASAELAAVIRVLKAEPAARACLGARARATFLARYSLQHAIERWIAVLEKL